MVQEADRIAEESGKSKKKRQEKINAERSTK